MENLDSDADGYSTCDGDCNDGEVTINPGAVEVWYDGVDQDCDEENDLIKTDGDFIEPTVMAMVQQRLLVILTVMESMILSVVRL